MISILFLTGIVLLGIGFLIGMAMAHSSISGNAGPLVV